MTTVLIYHRVADYDAWKTVYDEVDAGPLASDVRSYRIWRGHDDPNLVVIAETFDSQIAESTLTNPALGAAIANAGVDMSSMRIDYLDEVAFSTH